MIRQAKQVIAEGASAMFVAAAEFLSAGLGMLFDLAFLLLLAIVQIVRRKRKDST